MYAVTDLHLFPWDGFPSSTPMTRKGLTHCLQPPETLEADTGNPGNRHADPAGLAAGG